MKTQIVDFIKRYTVALAWVYFTILFTWLLIYLIFGSGNGYLDVVNNLAVFLFFPLPLIAMIALLSRRRELIAGTVLGVAAFLWFWGALFIPNWNASTNHDADSVLRVMTYNVLGLHEYAEPIMDVIRAEDADVVCLQEVNVGLANALQSELADEYPYQFLDPREGVGGMGTLSRYPLEPAAEGLTMIWVGTPQVFELDHNGKSMLLVNFHAHPYSFGSRTNFLQFQDHRQKQGNVLLSLSEEISQPLILTGDANDTSLSATYRTITSGTLKDVWREAGYGLGHTFPGSDLPGSSRWKIGNWSVPQWLTRIDYVFVSPHWDVLSARLAQFDGVSDHRGVVAELVLK